FRKPFGSDRTSAPGSSRESSQERSERATGAMQTSAVCAKTTPAWRAVTATLASNGSLGAIATRAYVRHSTPASSAAAASGDREWQASSSALTTWERGATAVPIPPPAAGEASAVERTRRETSATYPGRSTSSRATSMSVASSPGRERAGPSGSQPSSASSTPPPPPPLSRRHLTREASTSPHANPLPTVTLRRAPRRVSSPADTATLSHPSFPRGRKDGGTTFSTACGRNGRTTAEGGGRGTPSQADGSVTPDGPRPRPPPESTWTRVTPPHAAETLEAVITPATVGRRVNTTSLSPGSSSTGPSILAEQAGLGRAAAFGGVRDP
ncbi:unnamed protein product, partial [Ectocarpus sp. 13 AM-2016]